MKTCFKCKTEKPPEEFYRHPMMGDGRLGKCKECTKVDVRENYAAKRDRYLEYDRRRYRESPQRRAGIEASQKRHPDRHKARTKLRTEVAAGRIIRQPCEVCGEKKVDAHHEDYAKPLEVRWLCRKHHMQHHRYPRGCKQP